MILLAPIPVGRHYDTARLLSRKPRFAGNSGHAARTFRWRAGRAIRAAITLETVAFEDTGAIVAAMTTSIPGSASQRLGLPLMPAATHFVVRALNI
jgi:hypothetical protein